MEWIRFEFLRSCVSCESSISYLLVCGFCLPWAVHRVNARSIWSRVTISCMPSHLAIACTHVHHCHHHPHYLRLHRHHCRLGRHSPRLLLFFLLVTRLASRFSLPLGCTRRSCAPTLRVSMIYCSPPCCDAARKASVRRSRFRLQRHRSQSEAFAVATTRPASSLPTAFDCTRVATPVLEVAKLLILFVVKRVGPQCTDSIAAMCGSWQHRPRSQLHWHIPNLRSRHSR